MYLNVTIVTLWHIRAFLSSSAASLTIGVTSVFKSIPRRMFVEIDNTWNCQLKTYLVSHLTKITAPFRLMSYTVSTCSSV